MALLDVTQILTDPDLADSCVAVRRVEVIDAHGRSTIQTTSTPFQGVVTSISPSDLDRKDDYQLMSRSISVVTKFPLRGEVTGYQPDVVLWRGNQYLVKHLDPYPQFGPGFYQVECSSMDRTDLPLGPQAPIMLQFNLPANAGLMGVI